MHYAVTKVQELIDYLSRYTPEIQNENLSQEQARVFQLLQAIQHAQNNPQPGRFQEASVAYQADRAIRYLESLDLPSTASIARRVFHTVVKKELNEVLGAHFTPPAELLVDPSLDMPSQAEKYEKLAAISSYDPRFMKNSLLASLHCYRQAARSIDSENTARIEHFLKALTPPEKYEYSMNYLFTILQNESISFSIAHPRFIEVLQDFRTTVNESPSDTTSYACCTKRARELQKIKI